MDAAINQIRTLAAETDDISREALCSALTDLLVSIETPYTTLLRIASHNTLFAIIRIAVDIGLLKALTSEGQTVDPLVYQRMSLNITLLEAGILFHSVFVGITISLTIDGFVILLVLLRTRTISCHSREVAGPPAQ